MGHHHRQEDAANYTDIHAEGKLIVAHIINT
jgi:hypothetical protein